MDFKPYKIGKYLLLERLATGGMAEVYRAKASGAGGFEKQLAIKRILPSYTANEEFQRMFEYEARLSSMLTHSNIVQIYDFIRSNDTYLLAMEYVNGKNLRQIVNKLKKLNISLPIECALFIINETCRGLEYAHSKKDELTGKPLNIIHRDMSPQNIMISYEGAVKIVDFGIAKAKDRVDETRSGVIKGKFGYMSPEQANGLPIDLHSDIFSTGIILWELLTGKRLFSAESDLATLKLIQECVIPRPSLTNPKVNQDLERIVMKALAKDVPQRYANAGLFYRALQEHLNKHFPSFTNRDLGEVLQRVFEPEIEAENKRYEQLHRQSIPFSQGSASPQDAKGRSSEEKFDGSLTSSDHEAETAITFVDEEEIQKDIDEASRSHQVQQSNPAESQLISLKSISKVATVVRNTDSQKTTSQEPLGLERTQVEDMPVPTVAADSPVKLDKTQVTDDGSELFKQGTAASIEVRPIEKITSEPIPVRPGLRSKEEISVHLDTEEKTMVDSTVTGMSRPKEPTFREASSAESKKWDRRDPSATRERQRFEKQEGKKPWYPAVAMLAAFGVTAYLYQLLLGGNVPTIVQEIEPNRRTTGETRSEAEPNTAKEATASPVAVAECVVQFESDPLGAALHINGEAKGFTNAKVLVPCQSSLNYQLDLEGFEPLTENILIRKKEQRVFKSLKRVPTGNLELLVSQNVQISVNGKFVGNAEANKPFVLSLRAGKKHSVEFKNEIYGINAASEFTVEEGKIIRRIVRLDK